MLWLDGDYRQVDKNIFKENSGLERAVTRLSGNELFGYVNLPTSERSATARLADLLD
jgi:predicted ribonuclease YlaK